MVQLDRRGLRRQALPAVAAERAAAKKQRRHRVVIESVGQEQKKLKTTISFQARPPNGYTFIPAGNPELTTALKEASREANQQIYAVSASPHARVHDLSKEVHRIGFHFPTVIVAQVCQQYGITLTSQGVVADENADRFRQMRQKGGRSNGNADEKKDQITINTEARGAIQDLFPKIPENDLYTIIKGAFQKGQRKVGTANELSLVRRAQLSVVAHIRHVYTRYDKLLREVGYRGARAQVEGFTLKKLVEWRGDDSTGDGKQVLEDVFREVIVLSDDEDDSEDDADDEVQVISTRAHGWPLPSHHAVATGRPLSPHPYDYQSGDENNSSYRVVTQPRKRRLIDPASQSQASVQYRESRYAAWDRAREEYRANPSAVPTALLPLSEHDPSLYYREPEFDFNDPPARLKQEPMETWNPNQNARYPLQQVNQTRAHTQPEFVRGADGYVYERIYNQQQQAPSHQNRHEVPLPYVSAQTPSPRHAPAHEGFDSSVQSVSSHVLPSIEINQPVSPLDGRSRAPQHEYEYRAEQVERTDLHPPSHARPRKVQVIDLTEGSGVEYAERPGADRRLRPRRVVDAKEIRRPLDHTGSADDYDRSVRDPQRPRREIIDLSSPVFTRSLVPVNSRKVADLRSIDVKMEDSGIHSDRASRALLEVSYNAPLSHYTRGSVHSQHPSNGFSSPVIVRRDDQVSQSTNRYYVRQSNADYHSENSGSHAEHPVARRSARVPASDVGSISYSREYLPVIKNETLIPEQAAQQRGPVYIASSGGSQHGRYDLVETDINLQMLNDNPLSILFG